MIWIVGKSTPGWGNWFAWRPVVAHVCAEPDPRRALVWLEYVERRRDTISNAWEYRLPANRIPDDA